MSDIEKFLEGEPFLLFQDKTLRDHACKAVENVYQEFEKDEYVAGNQLHSIPAIIQSGGLKGFRKLVERQKEKSKKNDKKKKDKKEIFWNFLFELILSSSPNRNALKTLIKETLEAENLLENAAGAEDKPTLNRIKKENKEKMDLAMEKVLPIYFEHFNCHYFYHVNREAPEDE